MSMNDKEKLAVVSQKRAYNGSLDLTRILHQMGDQEAVLLESADTVTKMGEKSMLFLDLALRIIARDNRVEVTALLDEARPLLSRLAEQFEDEIFDRRVDAITFQLKSLHHHLDLLEKMRSRSALDILRAIVANLAVADEEMKKTVLLTGAFTYDFLDHFEKLPAAKKDILGLADFVFYLPLTVIKIDHLTSETAVIAHTLSDDKSKHNERFARASATVERLLNKNEQVTTTAVFSSALPRFEVDIADDAFIKLVEVCKEHIRAGDVYQIVPSRTFSHPIKDVLLTYQTLRQLNPSPYMFFLRTAEWTLFGASPETFIKVDQGGERASIRPIAGTRRRGFDSEGNIDPELDSREQASLCLDEKELAEHMMLVDLARNDIASVSCPRSRRITRLLGVDRFSHVMHLVSEVEGSLLADFDALSAYQASMNMGTLMGAPKVRAAELLRELEASKRGFYGGAIGYFDLFGDMDTAIIIRSALVKDGTAHVRAGCGVVMDSLPSFEMEETINKAEAVMRAIHAAGGGT